MGRGKAKRWGWKRGCWEGKVVRRWGKAGWGVGYNQNEPNHNPNRQELINAKLKATVSWLKEEGAAVRRLFGARLLLVAIRLGLR